MTKNTRHGLVLVYTGHGKGKTTSAMGMILRAWGQNMKVAMLQFVKSQRSNCGEHKALQRMGIEVVTMGSGFTWLGDNLEKNRASSLELWNIAREKIASGSYDMLVLDEFTYPLKFGWIQIEEVLEVLKKRSPELHIIITGRDANQELIDFADTAIEISKIKHHLDKGIKAQPGIEF